jgi:hypothetical protein
MLLELKKLIEANPLLRDKLNFLQSVKVSVLSPHHFIQINYGLIVVVIKMNCIVLCSGLHQLRKNRLFNSTNGAWPGGLLVTPPDTGNSLIHYYLCLFC